MCELCSGEFNHTLTIEIGRAAMLAQKLDGFGPLHAIIEDTNVEDEHFKSAMTENLSPQEQIFCAMMLQLSGDDRISVLALSENRYGACSIHSRPS